MDKLLTAIVVAATIVNQKLLVAYNAFVDDYPTRLEKRRSNVSEHVHHKRGIY
jgi:hypothetical protein